MKDYRLLHKNSIVNTYANRGLVILSGKGMYLTDENNEDYLDVMSNYGVSIFGHTHPVINQALTSQLQKVVTLHGSFINDKRSEAAEKLVQVCGHNLSHVYFCNSGTEAVEAALKFAVLSTGKKKFIACKNGYHGKTLGGLSATGEEKYRTPFKPLLWDFTHIDHNNPDLLEQAIDTETAAFIVEPIQGEGGIHLPNPDYLNKVREICDKHNILLIVDEIQTGCGRTGQFLASHDNNINYDMVCLGKGLAGGVPVGATLVSSEINAKIPKGSHSSTFGSNPLAAAGILAILSLFNVDLYKHINKLSEYFVDKLKSINSELIVDVRGKGFMIGVEIKNDRDKVLQQLQKTHILAVPAAENVVRFLPPFIIEKKHIDEVTNKLEIILKNMHV